MDPFLMESNCQHVDPFFVFDGGGNVVPGPSLPFGMVKLSPDCGLDGSNAGYLKGKPTSGFSHIHACGSGGDLMYGNIQVMATTGETIEPLDRCSFLSDEMAAPGIYQAVLARFEVGVSLTATRRTGFHRYHFQEGKQANILLDLGSFLEGIDPCLTEKQRFVGSEVEILDDHTLQGYNRVRGGWNEGHGYTVYFYAVFDQPAKSWGTWKGDRNSENGIGEVDTGEKTGAWFSFEILPSAPAILLKVGISFISCFKAQQNLEQENPGWDFDEVVFKATSEWNEVLGRVEIQTDKSYLKRGFYSALYSSMLMPVNKSTENKKWFSEEPFYDDFLALSGSFRTLGSLITLLNPSRQVEIVRSMIDITQNDSYFRILPREKSCQLAQCSRNAGIVFAEAYAKNLKGINYTSVCIAMEQCADISISHHGWKGEKRGVDDYFSWGYVGIENERMGVRSIEDACNDWATATVAQSLAYSEFEVFLKDQSDSWEDLLQKTGIRDAIFGRRLGEHSFSLPFDIHGFINQCGGNESFISILDALFSNESFVIGNDTELLTQMLYIYAGRPDLTARRVNGVRKNYLPDRQCEIRKKESLGMMPSCYVFQCLGFFPNAGQDVYLIGTPAFKKCILHLESGNDVEIISHDLDGENIYVQSALLNDESIDRAWFRHSEICQGAKLEFFMGPNPCEWGRECVPPSQIARI